MIWKKELVPGSLSLCISLEKPETGGWARTALDMLAGPLSLTNVQGSLPDLSTRPQGGAPSTYPVMLPSHPGQMLLGGKI